MTVKRHRMTITYLSVKKTTHLYFERCANDKGEALMTLYDCKTPEVKDLTEEEQIRRMAMAYGSDYVEFNVLLEMDWNIVMENWTQNIVDAEYIVMNATVDGLDSPAQPLSYDKMAIQGFTAPQAVCEAMTDAQCEAFLCHKTNKCPGCCGPDMNAKYNVQCEVTGGRRALRET